MLDGETIEELRRCSCCEIRRPLWAFTKKVQTERNGARGEYIHNFCRSCSSGSSPPQKAKRAGKPIGKVQRLANVAIDRIRANEALGAWYPSTHRPEGVSAESAFDWRAHPIVKMCKCCEEVRPHARVGSARSRIEFVSSAVTCVGCYNAEMRSEGSFLRFTMDERREKRDVSEILVRVYADRKARGVSWCSTCRQEHDVAFFENLRPGRLRSSCAGSRLRYDIGIKEGGRNLHIETIASRKLLPLEEIRRLAREATLLALAKKSGNQQPIVEPEVSTVFVKPPPPAPSLDEYVTSRQESFDRAEAVPKPSRQVRRATERRIAKDARSITKRIMTDVEVAREAISKGIAARSRANGGERTAKKTKSKVKWNLSPGVAAEILKRQGYRCALTGRPFQASTGFGSSNPYAPSPNRIDAGRDYTPENCEFVLWSINRLISDAPRLAALDLLADLGILNEKGPTQG